MLLEHETCLEYNRDERRPGDTGHYLTTPAAALVPQIYESMRLHRSCHLLLSLTVFILAYRWSRFSERSAKETDKRVLSQP